MPTSHHCHTLDFVRGIAAIAVVIYHASAFCQKLGFTIPYAIAGETGVQLFFVLSGYFIGNCVISPAVFSARSYSLSRTIRIVPNYYFSIFVIFWLTNAALPFLPRGMWDLAAHFTFLHGFFREYRVSINGVYWTLAIEWFFYLFMLFSARAIRHPTGKWIVAGGMILLAIVYKIVVWQQYEGSAIQMNFAYKQLPGMLDQFGCGLFVALLLKNKAFRAAVARTPIKIAGLLLSVAALVLGAILYADYTEARTYWKNPWVFVCWPLGFCAAAAGLLLFIQQFENDWGPWLKRIHLSDLGVISYSIYLYHTLVITQFSRGWSKALANDCPPWLYLTVLAFAVLSLSVAMYFLVEKPFMEMGSRLKKEPA